MIAFLRGRVEDALPPRIVLDVHGVGYEVLVPLSTFDHINPKTGDEIRLLTILIVREDAHLLYGFATESERDLFRLLIDRVSGVGPSIALSVIGSLGVDSFKQAVLNQNVTALSKAKGLGKKMAERIIVELKDKVGVTDTWTKVEQGGSIAIGDAELALLALGYKQSDARKVLEVLIKSTPDLPTDQLIRQALRMLN